MAFGSKVEWAMPVLKRDDAEIYFEEFGNGYPVLLFAPGGLRSRIEVWHAPPEGTIERMSLPLATALS
jgi:hypothetical protein